jgi:pilin isopeptide linkage protein
VKKVDSNEEKTEFTITNTFAPITDDPPVKKTVEYEGGTPTDATFTFEFAAVKTTAEGLSGKMPMPEAANGAQSMTVDVNYVAGTDPEAVEFGEFALVKPGVYTYTIKEVAGKDAGYEYDDTVYEVVYTVTANEETNALVCVKTIDGVEVPMGTPVDFEFVNEYKTINIDVTKIWEDNNDDEKLRPESITVHLLADGEEVDVVEISADEGGNWAYTFEDLPAVKGGKDIEYTITEDEITGYTTDITGDAAEGFVITNTHKPVPKTGFGDDLALWISLMMLSASMLIVAMLFVSRKKESY